MDRRPPLPISPRRLRTRFPPPSPSILSQISLTPRVTGTSRKRKPLNRSSPALSVSRRSMAARGGSATGGGDDSVAPTVGSKSPLFERGRLYDLYSARRNEWLERKMVECSEPVAVVTEDPAVAVVLAKRRLSKKAESARKSVLAHFSGSRGSSSRSTAVGSSKETRKAGSSSAASECFAAGGGRRNDSGSVRWL